LGAWNPQRLRSLRLGQAFFTRLVPIALPSPEPEVSPLEPEALTVDLGAFDVDTLEELLPQEEGWGLDELEELVSLEEAPTLAEGILGFLHRRFPSSTLIEGLLERARDRTLAGPRFDATPWLLLGGLIVVIIVGIMSLQWTTGPFTPTVDLNNPPSQEYPSFTFDPDAAPSPDL
ncbi:MAG: hypothetical protein MUP36_04180, partial [Demequinaceae bacterium]|nr:hypothetical protein [Demequinaceae bacterium]